MFANIAKYSQFPDEEEFLFDIDSSFELVNVVEDPEKDGLWIIQLRATDRGALLADKYVKDSNRELRSLSPELLLGKLFIDMGDYDKAIFYFQHLLEQIDKSLEGKFERYTFNNS